jgi:hypothetical protein
VIAVAADDKEICVRIPTGDLSREEAHAFVNWLRAEVIARQSKLSEEQAWQLSENIKANWWEQHKQRLPGE